ncbi:MAG TPA: hypothetical protein VFX97_05505 [Pyrinomonadaceae bacterium]|nr:hypothetical protein [Pyrinomonadaceae bacterium]
MIKDYCYVVPPPKLKLNDWRWVYDVLIQPIAIERGFKCDLGQVMGEPGALIDNILSKLIQAELAVVDVSECGDPRAYYQLGVRHARSNRTILISQRDANIPNDFKPYSLITYSSEAREISRFREQFQELIVRIRTDPEEPDNPVQRFLSGGGRLIEENQALQSRLTELEQTVRENKDLQGKVIELERTLTTLASAPQRETQRAITFKPVPPAGSASD